MTRSGWLLLTHLLASFVRDTRFPVFGSFLKLWRLKTNSPRKIGLFRRAALSLRHSLNEHQLVIVTLPAAHGAGY